MCVKVPDRVTYHADVTSPESEADIAELALVNKRRVIQFVWHWCSTVGDAFWEDKTTQAFLGVSVNLAAWLLNV